MKQAIIDSRQFLIRDWLGVIGRQADIKTFVKNRLTLDATFEDPLQRFEGIEEFEMFLNFIQGHTTNGEFKLKNEIHSANEIIQVVDVKVRWMRFMENIFTKWKKFI